MNGNYIFCIQRRGEDTHSICDAWSRGEKYFNPIIMEECPSRSKVLLSFDRRSPSGRSKLGPLVINIPAEVNSLEEGASKKKMQKGSLELKNSWGDTGYGGPQPPKGTGNHPYVITLYALNVEKVDLGVNTSLSAFKKAIEGKIISQASITGKYGR